MKTEKELRELDVWIAEHVMGLTKHRIDYTSDKRAIFETVWLPPSCPPTAPYDQIQRECECLIPIYSTNPAAAMLVLEKCGETETLKLGKLNGKWCVTKASWNGPFIEAETLPLAICLFARKLFNKEGV